MSVNNLYKLGRRYTLSELSFKKFLREQDKLNKAYQLRHELEEQTRLKKQEAAIKHERELEEKNRKIEEIKRKKQELLEKKKQKEYDIEFTKDRIAIRERRIREITSLNLTDKKKLKETKQKMIEEEKKMKRLEEHRFSAELADRAVLISYQRLPTILNLLRVYSKNDQDD